jgi:hypothetical protein
MQTERFGVAARLLRGTHASVSARYADAFRMKINQKMDLISFETNLDNDGS